MTRTFIISKKSVDLELVVDGQVEIRPLPDNVLGEETMKLLAQTYQNQFNAYLITHRDEDLVDVTVQYFKSKGFSLRET